MMPKHWDPLRDLLDLQERINRLFQETLSDAQQTGEADATAWLPLADVLESPSEYVVHVELPGVSDEDLGVQATDHRITLRGQRHGPGGVHPENYQRIERHPGPFARVFDFSREIVPESIEAHLRDGLLRLRVPKRGIRRIPLENDE
jgi:HSP20 family protein